MTNFQRNLSTGEVEVKDSVIYHKTEYRERRNHYAFYSVNKEIAGFDTDRESFVGMYNGLDAPQAVAAGEAANSVASGWSPIGSHALDITLEPGEAQSFIFVLGYIENPEDEKWEALNVINKSRPRLSSISSLLMPRWMPPLPFWLRTGITCCPNTRSRAGTTS